MSAPRYPKIDSLFERDENFKVDESKIRRPEFLIPSEWVVSEKLDGMNIRVSLEEEIDLEERPGLRWVVKYYGRGENSQFPPLMLEHLQKTFTFEKMQRLWRCKNNCDICSGDGWVEYSAASSPVVCNNLSPYQITLYGEGYGAGIQTGGGYNKDKTFRLFDVLVGETWLSRENVEDVARQLDIFCAPLIPPHPDLAAWSFSGLTAFVKNGFLSSVAFEEGEEKTLAEGIVAQTKIPLFNSRGQRLMFKLKTKDFA